LLLGWVAEVAHEVERFVCRERRHDLASTVAQVVFQPADRAGA
jgi:hypothetical protein